MSLFKRFGFDFSDMRVLLVEDNEFELNLGKEALKQLGYTTVVVARDGREAFETLEHFPNINLIISDWNMPHMNGLEFLRHVHERWPGTPFVMLTGNDSVEHVADARRAGVFAYVLKPFTLDNLQRKIIAAIRMRLAMGGDKADNDDRVYVEAMEQIEALTGNLGEDKSQPISKEFQRLEDAVESVLFSGESGEAGMREFRSAAKSVTENAGLDQDRLELVESVIGQLSEFVEVLDVPTPVQLEVVKLHVESTLAISSGRTEDFDMQNATVLLEGLQMAIARSLN